MSLMMQSNLTTLPLWLAISSRLYTSVIFGTSYKQIAEKWVYLEIHALIGFVKGLYDLRNAVLLFLTD
jgi:hypothetical protein